MIAGRRRSAKGPSKVPARPFTIVSRKAQGAYLAPESQAYVYTAVVVLFYAFMACLFHHRMLYVPAPLGADADATSFSEVRALQHASRLSTDIGLRVVSQPEVERSWQYILGEAHKVAADAAATRPDLVVEAEAQHVTGGINMLFLTNVIGNAYNNLTNVVLSITPKATSEVKGVLVATHYDSVIGSPGGSDCASQVGLMLEAARVLVASRDISLAGPVVFLFNGGEETFSQAAHGFMNSSRHSPALGAFVNLESIGNGGLDYLFQHSGAWTAEAYIRGAKYPRGSSVGQDIFETGLLPADSDFRMFSYRHYGSLPGLDIAFLLDGAAYHTRLDTVERIRPGTVQGLGENTLGVVREMTKTLASHHQNGVTGHGLDKHIYFDFLGMFAVSYTNRLARLLHSVPVAFVLAQPWHPQSKGGEVAVPNPTFGGMITGAMLFLMSSLMAVIAPAVLGLLRALLSGRPMVWYAQHWIAFLMYIPASAAALLLPYTLFPLDLRHAVLGVALVYGCAAALLTSIGAGSSFLFAACCIGAILGVPKQDKDKSLLGLLKALLYSAIPLMFALPLYFYLTNVLIDKTSLMGSHPPPFGPLLPDTIIGLIVGASTMFAGSSLTPWLASGFAKLQLKRFTLMLLSISVVVAVWASIMQPAFDELAPKRVFLQHLHQQGPDGAVVSSRFAVASADAIAAKRALNLSAYTELNSSYRDWQTFYPLTPLLRGPALQAPPPDPAVLSTPPSLRLLSTEQLGQNGARRLHLQLNSGKPCWGVMNFTGPLAGYSFAPGLPFSEMSQGGMQVHAVRFAGNSGSEVWPFWVDLKTEGALHVELAVTFWRTSAVIDTFAEAVLSPSSTLMAGTTYQSAWTFK